MSTENELISRRPSNIDALERELQELMAGSTETNEDDIPSQPVETVETTNDKPLSKEEETFKKRYGDLRRHSQKKENELERKIKELEQKLENQASMPTSKSQVKDWVEKNPDFAAIITALAEEQATKQNTQIKDSLNELKLEEEKNKIRKVHSDYDEIVATDEFLDWVDEQPTPVQDAIYDGGSKDVIWALNTYKRIKGIKPVDPVKDAARTASKRSTSAEPRVTTEGRFTESQVQAMTVQEYEVNQAAINEAIRKGTFIYDISGAAR